MTSARIDQLVFGYDDGHRLLGGSIDIPARALAILLVPLTLHWDSLLIDWSQACLWMR